MRTRSWIWRFRVRYVDFRGPLLGLSATGAQTTKRTAATAIIDNEALVNASTRRGDCEAIVLDGSRENRAMPGFGALLGLDDVMAIRSYVLSRRDGLLPPPALRPREAPRDLSVPAARE